MTFQKFYCKQEAISKGNYLSREQLVMFFVYGGQELLKIIVFFSVREIYK